MYCRGPANVQNYEIDILIKYVLKTYDKLWLKAQYCI